jgi:hypothetical protein
MTQYSECRAMLKTCSLKYMKGILRRKPRDQQYTGMQCPKYHVTNQHTAARPQELRRSTQPVARAPKVWRSPEDRSMAVHGATTCAR